MTEIKSWQHGYDLDYLKQIEAAYDNYNSYTVSPFSKYKKNDIARDLKEGTLMLGTDFKCVIKPVKVASDINMYGNVTIGRKLPGDVVISKLVGSHEGVRRCLDGIQGYNVWLYVWAEEEFWKYSAVGNGFSFVGNKITTHGEIYAIYFRDKAGFLFIEGREHPTVDPIDLIGLKKIANLRKKIIPDIATIVSKLNVDYTNHYSNYNKNKSWSAISLRGYSPDWIFITKPIEMNQKWKDAHKDEDYFLQDTEMYAHFPTIYELLQYYFDGPIHRVRFMKLNPGGGELERHTDQVDPDAGNNIGQVARFHFPIITNPDVVFSVWTTRGVKEDVNMKIGEMWLLDTRHPHMVINGGTTERVHLVVDVVVTPKIKEMILNARLE